jgi:hypothetical protein
VSAGNYQCPLGRHLGIQALILLTHCYGSEESDGEETELEKRIEERIDWKLQNPKAGDGDGEDHGDLKTSNNIRTRLPDPGRDDNRSGAEGIVRGTDIF